MSPFSHGVIVLCVCCALHQPWDVAGGDILSMAEQHRLHPLLTHSTQLSKFESNSPGVRKVLQVEGVAEHKTIPSVSSQAEQPNTGSLEAGSHARSLLLSRLLSSPQLNTPDHSSTNTNTNQVGDAQSQTQSIRHSHNHKNSSSKHFRLIDMTRLRRKKCAYSGKSDKQTFSRKCDPKKVTKVRNRIRDLQWVHQLRSDRVNMRSKRSPEDMKRKHVDIDITSALHVPTRVPTSARAAILAPLSRRKIRSQRKGKPITAKARRQQKAESKTSVNGSRQTEKTENPPETSAIDEQVKTDNELYRHESSPDILANVSSPPVPASPSTLQQGADYRGQGHSAGSTDQQQQGADYRGQGYSAGSTHQQQQQDTQRLSSTAGSSDAVQNPVSVAVENPPAYLGLDGKPVNMTKFAKMLKQSKLQRQLNREAQWAYLCLVTLICLMMLTMWCCGGLERCRYRPSQSVNFSDSQYLMSVQDVLKKKRQYLPMFTEPEWEEVLMYNRGTDP